LKKAALQTLRVIVFLLLGLLLLYLAFRNIKGEELKELLSHANYWWVGLSLLFAGAAYISRARRWYLIIKPMGYQPGQRNVYHALMTGYLANMALPRMGEITRCVMLGRKEKIPVDKLLGTVILERVIDFLTLLLIMLILLAVSFSTKASFFWNDIAIPVWEKISGLLGSSVASRFITIAILLFIISLLFIFRKRILGKTLYPKIREFLKGIMHGFSAFRTIENKWEFLFHSVFIWFCYIMMTWFIVFVLPSTSHLGFGDGVFLLVIGGFAMVAPVQSGLGAFHWIISRGLHLVYDIPLADGLAYALVSHTSQMILMAAAGFISLGIILHKSTGMKKEMADSQ
jgi:uncharacterized protein (TIRG00374 family)